MSEPEPSGEAKNRARTRRRWIILGGCALAGFFPGMYLGYTGGADSFAPGANWPPEAMIAIAIIYLVAVIGSSWLLRHQLDELQRHNYSRAACVAAGIYMLVYPVWWLLWMGGLVPEPSHWQLFILFYACFVGGYFWYARKTV